LHVVNFVCKVSAIARATQTNMIVKRIDEPKLTRRRRSKDQIDGARRAEMTIRRIDR
jgi:hypothetical protein